MKKVSAIIAIFLAAAMLTGCNVKESILNAASEALDEQISSALDDTANSDEETDNAAETGDGDADSGDDSSDEEKPDLTNISSWEQLYNAYADVAGDTYDAYSEKDTTFTSVLNLLYGDIDLAFTNSFFSENAETSVELGFSILGGTSVDYTESGETATVTFVNSDSEKHKYELTYSGKTAQLVSYTNDVKEYEMSICVNTEFWAKTYTNGDVDLHIVAYANGDTYMDINHSPTAASATLLKNESAAANPSFATEMTDKYQLVGGVFTTNVE